MSTVTMSAAAAEGLSRLGVGDVGVVETAERMAWVVFVARHAADDEVVFPRGKWATIQHIEAQLDEHAKRIAGGGK